MCNCIEKIETDMRAQFAGHLEQDTLRCTVSAYPEIESKAFVFADGKIQDGNIRMYAEVRARYNSGNRPRLWNKKIVFTYCPFCGEKTEKGVTDAG